MKKRRRSLTEMNLPHARIYIIPTRFGGVFLAGACVMLLVGATYQNNLVNLLAFFMFSLVFVAMVQTHQNIKDIKVESVDFSNGFAGGELATGVSVKNLSTPAHFNLEATIRDLDLISVYSTLAPLLSLSTSRMRSTYRCPTRGKHTAQRVRLSSVFPLGLFYAWAWFDVQADFLIYPAASGGRPLPTVDHGIEDATSQRQSQGGDDFHGHRRFAPGDSPRHVDWKARARGRPLMIKEFNEGAATSILLDWYLLEGLSTEERLSQLTQWIEDASKKRIQFAMRTPRQFFNVGQGAVHAQRCLEHLALFDQTEAPTSAEARSA